MEDKRLCTTELHLTGGRIVTPDLGDNLKLCQNSDTRHTCDKYASNQVHSSSFFLLFNVVIDRTSVDGFGKIWQDPVC